MLPMEQSSSCYQLYCLKGEGYLRVMSSSRRQLIKRGGQLTIFGGDVVTLTGKKNTSETMIVELRHYKK